MSTPIAIDIVNYSTAPGLDEDLLAILTALGKQLAYHVQPFWGRTMPTLRLRSAPSSNASPLAIFDDADQAGAFGYHDQTPQGLPYGRVFARTILSNGGTIKDGPSSVSVTLSHECLEIIGDPSVNWWADNVDGYSYAMELCDAVEGDAYLIDDIHVSNFVLPAYFNPHAPAGTRLDYLHKLSRPFTMTRGGYQIRRRADGQVMNVFASAFPTWKRPLKDHPAARTLRRLQKPYPYPAEVGARRGQETPTTETREDGTIVFEIAPDDIARA